MGIVRRNSIWNSLIQYAGVILGYVNLVLLFPSFLELDQFGLTRLLLSVTIVIAQFSQFGTPNMIIRFFPRLERRSLTIGIWICSAGLAIILSLFFIFRGAVEAYYIEQSSLFVDYYYLLIPFSIAMVFYNLFDAYLKAFYKNVLSASMPFIFLRVLWMILILVYAQGTMSFHTFIILYAMAYSVIMLATLIYIAAMRLLPDSLMLTKEDASSFRQIQRFNTYNILSGISSFLINKVDILMLGAMLGLSDVGIYSIPAAMAMVIRIPASSIARTAPSLIAEAFHRKEIDSIDSLYKKSAINQFILCGGAFLLILVNYDLLLSFLDDEFSESLLIFLFLGLSQVFDTGAGLNGYIMVNSIYYRVDAFFSVLLLIMTIVTNLLLIPAFGVMGAAIATAISLLAYNIMRLLYLRIRMGLNPFTRKNILALLLFAFAGLIAWFVPTVGSIWVTSFVKTVILLLITVPGVYFSRFSPELNELMEMSLRFFRK